MLLDRGVRTAPRVTIAHSKLAEVFWAPERFAGVIAAGTPQAVVAQTDTVHLAS
jgi:hypothetical protein